MSDYALITIAIQAPEGAVEGFEYEIDGLLDQWRKENPSMEFERRDV